MCRGHDYLVHTTQLPPTAGLQCLVCWCLQGWEIFHLAICHFHPLRITWQKWYVEFCWPLPRTDPLVICCNPGRPVHMAGNTELSTESEISVVFLCTGFWNSSKGSFISGEIPFGRLDLGWSLEGHQARSLWSVSTDSKTLDNQRTNPRGYQIVRTHTKETTWIQDQASPNHQ